jgi:hypothetical protein
MNPVYSSRGYVALATALCALLVSKGGLAQPASGDAQTPVSGQPATAGPLRVWVDPDGGNPDAESLRESLQHELGRPVSFVSEAQAADVQIRWEAAHAQVRYTTPGGEQLSRRVELPGDRKRALLVVTWLTVNLVRDEASELLDELRARHREEAEARAAADKAAADKAAADKAAADKAAADKAAADKAAADKAAADKAAADKAAADKAAADKAAAEPSFTPGLLRDPWRSVDAAFVTPMSVVPDSPKRALKLQLALVYGDAGGIEGLGVSLGALRVRRELFGIATGVGATLVGGRARGIVVSAGYAQVDGVLEGIQIGGGAAWQRGRLARGVLVAAGGVIASDLTGVEVAGGFVSARSLNGVAAAVGASVMRGPSRGLLVAGGGNVSSSHRGLEMAGGINTARELDGLAVAPLNVHRHVRGLQIGVVNVAEQVDGAAIGVVSYARSGKLQPVLFSSTEGFVQVALKSTVGYVFTQLGAGIDVRGAQFSYDAGIGLHLALSSAWFFEPGLLYSATSASADASGAPDAQRFHYLAQLGFRAWSRLDLLAGVALRHTFLGAARGKLQPELQAGIAFF